MSSLKEKAISGMMWNAVERFGSTFFLFLSNLVLARLLMPSDFGTVAMLMVFISISETIVDAGFGSALIQKKDVDEKDYSTVFIWNIFFSLFLYSILYICSPFIANFYNDSLLCNILRVQGIVIILNSFIIVQIAKLKKELNFRLIAKINLLSVIVGTIAAILCAVGGMGVWSLVVKMVLQSLIQVFCYWSNRVLTINRLSFNIDCFCDMFKFSIFIFLNRLINSGYNNILSLLVGKIFSAASLGYYSQANKLSDIPRSVISSIVNNVAFPAYSSINEDLSRLKVAASKSVKCLSLISVPVMICGIVVAKPLIILLFTDKWITSVEYFQILCIAGLSTTMMESNSVLLNSIGRSNISFYVRVFEGASDIVLMCIGIQYGMIGLLAAYALGQFLSFCIGSFFSGKYISYGFFSQIRDIAPFLFFSIVASVVCEIESIIFKLSDIFQLLIYLLTFVLIYSLLILCFCKNEKQVLIETICNKIKK